MKIYLVGGSIRDELLGLEPKDQDYVVVGATPEEMLNAGYKQVGAEFPVFLHPDSGEEYALARTEVKNGNGYQGFNCAFGPEVTLEEDLARRDLTINAMARDVISGELYDPYGGQQDLEDKVLRPTTEAFREDPVRVLRVARFLARYDGFSYSDELFDTIGSMINSGELEHLKPERVWIETEKALMEPKPSRYFKFLRGMEIFPEIDNLQKVEQSERWHPEGDAFIHTMMVIDEAARRGCDLETRFGCLMHDLGKWPTYQERGNTHGHEGDGVEHIEAFCRRLKIPNDHREFAKLVSRYHTHTHKAFELKPATLHDMIAAVSRKDFWFARFLDVCVCDKNGRAEPACDWDYFQPAYVHACEHRMRLTDTKPITDRMAPGPAVGEAIRSARIASIRGVHKEFYQSKNLKGEN